MRLFPGEIEGATMTSPTTAEAFHRCKHKRNVQLVGPFPWEIKGTNRPKPGIFLASHMLKVILCFAAPPSHAMAKTEAAPIHAMARTDAHLTLSGAMILLCLQSTHSDN